MCFLKRQRAHCFVLFEWGRQFGIFFFTPFDQGVKFFSPLNAIPQFDDFMFHELDCVV